MLGRSTRDTAAASAPPLMDPAAVMLALMLANSWPWGQRAACWRCLKNRQGAATTNPLQFLAAGLSRRAHPHNRARTHLSGNQPPQHARDKRGQHGPHASCRGRARGASQNPRLHPPTLSLGCAAGAGAAGSLAPSSPPKLRAPQAASNRDALASTPAMAEGEPSYDQGRPFGSTPLDSSTGRAAGSSSSSPSKPGCRAAWFAAAASSRRPGVICCESMPLPSKAGAGGVQGRLLAGLGVVASDQGGGAREAPSGVLAAWLKASRRLSPLGALMTGSSAPARWTRG